MKAWSKSRVDHVHCLPRDPVDEYVRETEADIAEWTEKVINTPESEGGDPAEVRIRAAAEQQEWAEQVVRLPETSLEVAIFEVRFPGRLRRSHEIGHRR